MNLICNLFRLLQLKVEIKEDGVNALLFFRAFVLKLREFDNCRLHSFFILTYKSKILCYNWKCFVLHQSFMKFKGTTDKYFITDVEQFPVSFHDAKRVNNTTYRESLDGKLWNYTEN